VVSALDDAERAVKRPPRASRNGRGFTLLELLVVVAILGLLAGFVGPRYFGQIGKSEVATARRSSTRSRSARPVPPRHRRYPSAEARLKALVERPQNEAEVERAVPAQAVPNDRGKPFVYKIPVRKATSTSSPSARTARRRRRETQIY